jgi:hypothetical protein
MAGSSIICDYSASLRCPGPSTVRTVCLEAGEGHPFPVSRAASDSSERLRSGERAGLRDGADPAQGTDGSSGNDPLRILLPRTRVFRDHGRSSSRFNVDPCGEATMPLRSPALSRTGSAAVRCTCRCEVLRDPSATPRDSLVCHWANRMTMPGLRRGVGDGNCRPWPHTITICFGRPGNPKSGCCRTRLGRPSGPLLVFRRILHKGLVILGCPGCPEI